MSRVDDDNSDLQRIRDLNEAAFRQKAQNEKKDLQSRVEKSFQQVLNDRGRQEQTKAKTEQGREVPPEQRSAAEQILNRVRQKTGKEQSELARRAALSSALHGGLSKKRAQDGAEAGRAEGARVQDLSQGAAEELDHVKKVAREEDEREVVHGEEHETEVKRQTRGDEVAVERDPERRDQKNRGGRGRDEKKAENAEATEGPRAAHRVTIPPGMLEHIVRTIHAAVSSDGRTEMHVDLKGPMLDGVTIHVTAEGGKVQCELSGCSDELKKMLRGGKDALARGLSKRGLKLTAFRLS